MDGFDWNDLRVFLAIARARSIRSAAKALRVSHSTVSRRLDVLERDLGVRLFDRLPDGFVPSAAGERVLAHAESVETQLFGLEREVLGRDAELAGAVQITLPPPLARLLMPDLVRFGEQFPGIDVELVSTYELVDLTRRDADIAIRFGREPEPWLLGRRLPDFAEAIYATPDYVERHTFAGTAPTARWIGWRGDGARPDWTKAMPHPDCPARWQVDDLLVQVEAARAGLGMTVIPCWIGDTDPDLVRVPPGDIAQRRPGWILTHPDLRTSERVRTTVRFLVDALRGYEPMMAGRRPRSAGPPPVSASTGP